MQVPLEIVYRNVRKSDEIDSLIREKAAALERVCDHIISCHIAVEQPQQHQSRGNPYRVRIDARVPPRHEVVIKREASGGYMHDSLPTVIRDAFHAARLKLEKLNEIQHGRVKSHPAEESQAFVTRLFPERDYGFLETTEGEQVFFHRGSLVNRDLEELREGDAVHLTSTTNNRGTQAVTVRRVEPARKR